MTILNHVRTGPRSDGVPMVLLHSAGLDLTYWDAQFAELSRHRDVIAVDLPGHGFSSATTDHIRIEQMAAAVSETMVSIGVPSADVVGLSVGGLIAQHLALTDPALVRSLSLLDTAARFAPAGQHAMRERAGALRGHRMREVLDGLFSHWFLPTTRDRRPDLIDRASKTLLRNDVDVQAALWEAIADVDVLDRLGAITIPTLILVGEHDSSSPVASARELRDAIPGARMAIIDNAAHLAPIEQPEAVTRHLDAFLRSVGTRATR